MTRSGSASGKPKWRVVYHREVIRDLERLDKTILKRVQLSIEAKLLVDPTLFGLPLRRSLKHLWKLRVGDWRIVYQIVKQEIQIMVIAHRSEAYDLALDRWR